MKTNIIISNIKWYENWNKDLPAELIIPEDSGCTTAEDIENIVFNMFGVFMSDYSYTHKQTIVEHFLQTDYHIEVQERDAYIDVTNQDITDCYEKFITSGFFDRNSNCICISYTGANALANALHDCENSKTVCNLIEESDGQKFMHIKRKDVYVCHNNDDQLQFCVAKGPWCNVDD